MLNRKICFYILIIFTLFISSNQGRADVFLEEKAAKESAEKSQKNGDDTKVNSADEGNNQNTSVKKKTKNSKANKSDADKDAASYTENSDKGQLACTVTPIIEPEFSNQKPFKKGNNLMRKAGSPLKAKGNYAQISGIVVDENCLPIQGAVIEIWQADLNGRYEWEYDTNSYWEVGQQGKDENFLFSGTAQTDNLGRFNLITIFPGAKKDNAPYINFIVKREGYDELRTRMYFSGHPRNDNDHAIASMKDAARAKIIVKGQNVDQSGASDGRVYYFPITMRGIDAYKRF